MPASQAEKLGSRPTGILNRKNCRFSSWILLLFQILLTIIYYFRLNYCILDVVSQGRLKIWTEHSTLILLISKPFDVVLPKFQHAYNLEKNEFSPNLEGVAQKMGPPRPFQF